MLIPPPLRTPDPAVAKAVVSRAPEAIESTVKAGSAATWNTMVNVTITEATVVHHTPNVVVPPVDVDFTSVDSASIETTAVVEVNRVPPAVEPGYEPTCVVLSPDTPIWMTEGYRHLIDVDLGLRFMECLNKWVEFELRMNYGNLE
jgi:hypothetical protein